MEQVIGVDVGGTFTDFVAFGADGNITSWKLLSTPATPESAVIEGLAGRVAVPVVHGSTVATNALLERRGARVALIVTQGFEDILEIRRQMRPVIYDLEPRRRPHVVARGDVIAVAERLSVEGEPVLPLIPAEIERAVAAALQSGADAFAICLLYGYTGLHERPLADALRAAGLDVCASHEVMPEHREYERASTTAVNAFLRPLVHGYLSRLEEHAQSLRVIHSAGGLAPVAQAADLPVTMVTSGPAGGVLGALAVAKAAGYGDIITFDMGGTSTDLSVCPGGEPLYRTASEVDGLAIHTPMIDIVTVGAGGGSIARIDEGGALHVGPESAGADPGPACYGRGTLPTVSDANAVLGRLRPEQLLAGALSLDTARAVAALDTLGQALASAHAVIDVVNANMAAAMRAVSLERGFDAGAFTLVAFGGAGPLHACELAEAVGIPRVLVPRHPGVLSALGMVAAPLSVERSLPARGLPEPVRELSARLAEDAARAADEGGWPPGAGDRREAWSADVRYFGQGHELRVELPAHDLTFAEVAQVFHAAHLQRFGYANHNGAVEIVNVRLRLSLPAPSRVVVRSSELPNPVARPIEVDGVPARLYRREDLGRGTAFDGPAVVVQDDAATWIPAGWSARVDAFANLVLEPAP